MNKKSRLLTIVILILVCIILGVSYAYWQITRTQNDKNIVTTGCFEVESDIGTEDELDPIRLLKTYPISDNEGKELSPFTFTLRNTCDTYAGYQINLETLNTTTLNLDYLKVVMDDGTPLVLSSYDSVEKTLSDATTSHKLLTGGLKSGASQTFNLRLWLDQDTPLSDGQNKTYEGKIVIIASPEEDKTATTKILSLAEGSSTTSTDVIEAPTPENVLCNNTLAYDGTADNSLRYVGSNPCNYVCFNGECPHTELKGVEIEIDTASIVDIHDTLEACNTYLENEDLTDYERCEEKYITSGGWRIIGVMNNIDDGNGKTEQRIKLIRNDNIGIAYSWNISESNINDGWGINAWGESGEYSGSIIMKELNTDFLNPNLSSNPMWYGINFDTREYGLYAEFDKSMALNNQAQSMIGNAVWYTGAANDTSINDIEITAGEIYINERNNNPHASNNGKYCTSGNYCNDNITRTYEWAGKVALIYPSDYLLATSGGSTLSRSACINNRVSDNNYWDANDCGNNSWISENYEKQWTISPEAESNNSNYVVVINYYGRFQKNAAAKNFAEVLPVVYLKPSVKITNGNGTEVNPYILES